MKYLKDIKYTCDDHQLDVACLGCIKVLLNKKNALIEFVKQIANDQSDWTLKEEYTRAKDLLLEMGEL